MKLLRRAHIKDQTSNLKPQTSACKRRGLKIALAACLLLISGPGAALAWLTHDLPPVEGLTGRAAFASTRILDRHGKLLYELFDPQGGQRTLVPLADVPPVLRDAVISTEDNNFYHNPGLDAGGLVRALWSNLT